MGFNGCHCEGESFARGSEYDRHTYHAIMLTGPLLQEMCTKRLESTICAHLDYDVEFDGGKRLRVSPSVCLLEIIS